MTEQRDLLNWTGAVVASGLVSILAFVTWALVYRTIPEANQNALTLLIGILSANVGAVVGFYFGSSSQAKKQADTIDTLAKTADRAGAALAPTEPAIPVAPGESVTVKGEEAP